MIYVSNFYHHVANDPDFLVLTFKKINFSSKYAKPGVYIFRKKKQPHKKAFTFLGFLVFVLWGIASRTIFLS